MDGDARMNDVTIKFNKITQDNETWPPEGETVLLSNPQLNLVVM
mgnify:CR=1 FL=1